MQFPSRHAVPWTARLAGPLRGTASLLPLVASLVHCASSVTPTSDDDVAAIEHPDVAQTLHSEVLSDAERASDATVPMETSQVEDALATDVDATDSTDFTLDGPMAYQVGFSPQWIAAADFNADGHVDLAVSNNLSATISVVTGTRHGQLSRPPSRRSALEMSTDAMIAADVNR